MESKTNGNSLKPLQSSENDNDNITINTDFSITSLEPEDVDLELNKNSIPTIRPSIVEPTSSLWFKFYVVTSMIAIWSSYTLLIKYTQTNVSQEDLYFSCAIPFFSEIVKIIICFLMLFNEVGMEPKKFFRYINNNLLKKPKELLKLSPPALCYIIQNNLDIIAMKNLPAGVFQVTSQLKIVSTAIFMVMFLKKKISTKKWICIIFCFIGIAIVQVGNMQKNTSTKVDENENPIIGLISIVIVCVVAGFAGVYFEKMLKDGSQNSLWIRNIQLYFWGIPASFTWILIDKGSQVYDKAAIGGIYISLIMKYLDNIQKSFAAASTIIVVTIVSVIIFTNFQISFLFIIGSCTTISSIIAYNKFS
ncbi:CMP-sialic acid transporter [Strongyloides ratti]|uniref:CMP-sialic acid transporter n=1 Tax=Strongyloides ratti TaxID=34506 RepID=A0A090MYG3_STRRB|nr:CMP-sialic acid transporter [Strongyloides ratti]CEF67134.1 CMP-sialic acid transporter [Strongyloides ratti]